LYTASKVSSEFLCFDIDGDIDPMFKVITLSLSLSLSLLIFLMLPQSRTFTLFACQRNIWEQTGQV